MSKFTFIYDDRAADDELGALRTYEFDATTWGQALQHFQDFLNGCGFIIPPTEVHFKDVCEAKFEGLIRGNY